jgi:hypothetical protein
MAIIPTATSLELTLLVAVSGWYCHSSTLGINSVITVAGMTTYVLVLWLGLEPQF